MKKNNYYDFMNPPVILSDNKKRLNDNSIENSNDSIENLNFLDFEKNRNNKKFFIMAGFKTL
jgi:hypothetical protein